MNERTVTLGLLHITTLELLANVTGETCGNRTLYIRRQY